ncbi:MAG: condensation domain-containing protein [Propionibacteriaceae bacterium]|jgi:non-ribosomal peptide synthetase component F|nr:condensation domain-containing protein [Propionibacteriaceae bacterium]
MTSLTVAPGVEAVAWLTDEQSALLRLHLARPHAEWPPLAEQQAVIFWGPLDQTLAAQAVQLTVIRHSALRSAILHRGVPRPVQVVLARRKARVGAVDLTPYDAITRGRQAAALQASELRRGFDVQADPLLRVTLIRQGPEQSVVVWTYHPLVLDAESFPAVCADFLTFYERLRRGAAADALVAEARRRAELAPRFADYARAVAELPDDSDYWAGLVEAAPAPARPAALTPTGGGPAGWRTAEDHLSEAVTAAVVAGARAQQLPLSALVGAAWGLVVQRATGSRDVVVGRLRSARAEAPLAGVTRVVGPLAQVVPVRIKAVAGDTAGAFAARVAAQAAAAACRPRCDLAAVDEAGRAGVAGAGGGVGSGAVAPDESVGVGSAGGAAARGAAPDESALCATVVTFADAPFDAAALSALGRARVRLDSSHPARRAACQAAAELAGGRLRLAVYCDAPYVRRDAERILGWWASALQALATEPDEPLDDLDIIPAAERRQLFDDFNGPAFDYPADATVAGLVAARAAATPGAVALVTPGRSVTRAGLERAVAGARARLSAAGAAGPVSVTGPRGGELVAVLLACAGSGLPFAAVAGPEGEPVRVTWDGGEAAFDAALWDAEPADAPELVPGGAGARLTSGAPGTAAITHAGFVNLALNPRLDSLLTGDPGDRDIGDGSFCHTSVTKGTVPNVTPIPTATVVSVNPVESAEFLIEALAALARGVPVVFPQAADLADSGRFLQLVWTTGSTVLIARPELLERLTSGREQLGSLTGLRRILVVGPEWPAALVRRLSLYTPATWSRAYAPTGTELWATVGPVADVQAERPDVGSPLANTAVYVLDRLRPCGIGQIGEVCLAGPGVPPGPGERDLANPFQPGRLWRTGDQARWLPDGQLDFVAGAAGALDEWPEPIPAAA